MKYSENLTMKPEIHPEYNELKVTCSCGATYATKSTSKELNIEICSNCHPFYTGKQKLVDTAGKVDRFKQKYASFQRPSDTEESDKESA